MVEECTRWHGYGHQLHHQPETPRKLRLAAGWRAMAGTADAHQLHHQRKLRKQQAAGCDNYIGTTTLTNCTISGNSTQSHGGGVFNLWHGDADRLHHQWQLGTTDGGGVVLTVVRHDHTYGLYHQWQLGNYSGGGVT